MTPIQLLLAGSRKADGSPNAGGRCFLYRPGTSVAVTGYQDKDGSAIITLDSGGILLDAAGKRKVYIDQTCDVREETSDGTLIATTRALTDVTAALVEVENDGFTGVDSSGVSGAGNRTDLNAVLSSMHRSFGGLDAQYKHATAAVGRNFSAWMSELHISLADYGAVGDDATDNTAAFLAVASVTAQTHQPVFIPAGVFRISSAITFPANTVFYGVGRGSGGTTGSVIKCTNSSQNGLIFGASATLSNFCIFSSVGSSGTAITVGSTSLLIGISTFATPGGTTLFDVALDNSSSRSTAINCSLKATTTIASRNFIFVGGSRSGGAISNCTAAIGSDNISVATSEITGIPYASGTQDLANGGTATVATPGAGQAICHGRVRATSAGAGTVNPPTHRDEILLVMELYNNSGGAFTFTFGTGFKSTGTVAPANGSRITCSFVYDATDAVYVEASGRATTT